jgi:hypothetical protein
MKASRNRQRGKDSEREVAKILGGKRVGIMGGEDISHPDYSIEVKSRQSFVAKKWMEQAKRNSKGGKIPLVVVHAGNTPHATDLVLLNIEDFKKITTKE